MSRQALRIRLFLGPFAALLCLQLCGCLGSETRESDLPAVAPEEEEAAARALFLSNIKAIQEKNRENYLACYRQDERLVRAGENGVDLGYTEFALGTAASGSSEWPERLEADEVEVHWVAPGVVYGSYRYRVTIEGKTSSGLSERVFINKGGAWKIAVSTAFEVGDDEGQGNADGQGDAKPGSAAAAKVSVKIDTKASRLKPLGGLTRLQLQEVIGEHILEIQHCLEEETRELPKPSGKLVMEWVIDPSGRVTSVNALEGTTLRDAEAVGCIGKKMKAWRFPRPRHGRDMTVRYPFIINAQD